MNKPVNLIDEKLLQIRIVEMDLFRQIDKVNNLKSEGVSHYTIIQLAENALDALVSVYSTIRL